MTSLKNRIARLAPSRATVLVCGPSGSGKELVARALHQRPGAFLAINCGALSANLAESELFGHTKGAFTGATQDKVGAFEAADGGTLFLDEIGELPLDLQPKLLRVLETMTVRRVGGTEERSISTRVVAATHRDLIQMVEKGTFREDLYHRLSVLTIAVPSLEDRKDDVPLLARHFLALESEGKAFTAEAESALAAHAWRGNVRELRNVILRACLLTETSSIDVEDLELEPTKSAPAQKQESTIADERAQIIALLAACGDNRARAARVLGISKSTLHSRIKRLGIKLKNTTVSWEPALRVVASGG